MINILLITLIVRVIFDLIMKPKYTALNCGIWGFYGKDSKGFSWDKFNMLGVFNDSRGGDACGISTPEFYMHNNTNKKSYINLAPAIVENIDAIGDTRIIFGHTRKASAGYSSKTGHLGYTQPLVRVSEEYYVTDMFCHNGTIYELEKLAKKSGVDFDNSIFKYGDNKLKFNDSQLLFDAIIRKDYEFLERYIGGAAFSYYDSENDELILFSGSSRDREYSQFVSNERPLYILEKDDHIWFSSMENSLELINDGSGEIFHIEENTLIIFKNGVYVDSTTVNRSNAWQSNSQYGSYGSYYGHGYNEYYDNPGWDDTYIPTGRSNVVNTVVNTVVKKNKSKTTKPKDSNKLNFSKNILESETIPGSKTDYTMKFARGRFWFRQNLAQGIFHITKFGIISDKPVKSEKDYDCTTPYYFYQGVWILNHEYFDLICKEYNKKKFDNHKLTDIEFIADYSVYPVNQIGNNLNSLDRSGNKFTGKIEPITTNMAYEYNDGRMIVAERLSRGLKFIHEETRYNNIVSDDEINDEQSSSYDDDVIDEMVKQELRSELEDLGYSIANSRDKLASLGDTEVGRDAYNTVVEIENMLDSVKL